LRCGIHVNATIWNVPNAPYAGTLQIKCTIFSMMIATTNNNKTIAVSKLVPGDIDKLCGYLQNLSAVTIKRFGPHAFDKQSAIDFYKTPAHWGYVAYDQATATIVAYAILKMGYLEHDGPRLQSYGLLLNHKTDCTFAPSVADAWQGCGVGNNLFQFILLDLKNTSANRIILWGGVQADNDKALHYYEKNGFKILGQFNNNGDNYDMILDLN
jgi:diamine N-acetyltransferase